jgi:hypothetical protein
MSDLERLTFSAEVEAAEGEQVRLVYLIEASAELVLPRDWWEQMGSPAVVTVTVAPDTQFTPPEGT